MLLVAQQFCRFMTMESVRSLKPNYCHFHQSPKYILDGFEASRESNFGIVYTSHFGQRSQICLTKLGGFEFVIMPSDGVLSEVNWEMLIKNQTRKHLEWKINIRSIIENSRQTRSYQYIWSSMLTHLSTFDHRFRLDFEGVGLGGLSISPPTMFEDSDQCVLSFETQELRDEFYLTWMGASLPAEFVGA